jgi:hypothetical protein
MSSRLPRFFAFPACFCSRFVFFCFAIDASPEKPEYARAPKV